MTFNLSRITSIITRTKNLILVLVLSLSVPVLAHHPFGMGESLNLSLGEGLLSGIGHPLLGPDHFLFLLAISLLGLKSHKNWIIPLLTVGLSGTALAQLYPPSETITFWAEALVSLSLSIEGLMILGIVSLKALFPLLTLHGYLLGTTIVGAEPTPLLSYFFGLLLSQGIMLLFAANVSQRVIDFFKNNNLILTSGIWIGIGLAFSWVAIID